MRVVHPFRYPELGRVDAGFLDPRYPEWRKKAGLTPAEHPGADLNLVGTSGNQDYGYPVVAVASGQVVHVREHRVWGKIVLIEHQELARVLGLPYLATQYAHLAFTTVREGEVVLAGEPVGSVGWGDPRAPFLAHLHFEVRKKPFPADYWPGTDKKVILEGYLDPEVFLKQNLSPELRFSYPAARVYTPKGFWTTRGSVVINLNRPDLAHIRFEEDPSWTR